MDLYSLLQSLLPPMTWEGCHDFDFNCVAWLTPESAPWSIGVWFNGTGASLMDECAKIAIIESVPGAIERAHRSMNAVEEGVAFMRNLAEESYLLREWDQEADINNDVGPSYRVE